jgi:hypothetical protein
MGLPEMYLELEKSDWTMNDEIADKILIVLVVSRHILSAE